MRLQSSVYFNISAKLCYLWTRSDPNRYIVDLMEQEKEQMIPVHLNDDKNRNESELVQCVKNFCINFVEKSKTDFYLDKLTYKVSLYRTVHVCDIDDKNRQSHSFSGGGFNFIITTNNALIYPNDIKTNLNVPFYFKDIKPKNLDPKIPVFIEKYDKHNADVRPLTPNDTVVGPDLKQLWPTPTGQIPNQLVELLKKTSEPVLAR